MSPETELQKLPSKPQFSVQRYFSLASLVGIVLVAIALCYLFRYFSVEQLLQSGQQNNVTFARALQNNIWPQYAPFIGEASTLTTEELKKHDINLKTHLRILRTIKGLPVLKVKIFDLNARTVFSTDVKQFGAQKPPEYAGSYVAKTGKVHSEIKFKESFSAIQGQLSDRYVISSYLPIYNDRKNVIEGVIEVYYDVTDSIAAIEKNQLLSFFGIIATLSILYIVMLLISKHADKIIQKQAVDIDSYVEKVEEQNEMLEKRVARRTDALNRAIEELEYHQQELETRVLERTKELQEARDDAIKANNSKSIFLANMSHELRTPLNAILGYAEILREDVTKQTDPRYISNDLNKIYTAGTHLLGIINDILDISKIESGKVDLFFEEIHVQKSLEELIVNAKALAKQNNNQLILECEANLDEFTTDSTKFRQIIYNLLSNANKFTQNGEIRVRALRVTNEEEEWLKIMVTDNGIGMSPEQMSTIFENFSQADESTTRRFGGTGLGLAICKGLCGILGGTISVESEVKKGSTFIIRLPIKTNVRHANNIDEVLQIGPKVNPALVRLNTRVPNIEHKREKISTVLSVDDDAEVRDLMERFLTRNGFYIHTAASASEGLEMAKELKPDIILTDIMMPDRDGITFIKDLNQHREFQDTPIVVVTIAGERETCMNLGAAGYLNKPIDWPHLLEVIQINLRKSEMRRMQSTA